MTMGHWLAVTLVAILLAELITGWHRGIYRAHDFKVTGGCILLSELTRPLSALCYATLFTWLLPNGQNALAELPFWPSTIALLVITDFVFYWVHRLAHDPVHHHWLWGMHRTHHAAKYLNVTVMARVNIFWPFVVPMAWISGLAFYLGLHAQSAFVISITILWNAFTHSALRWDDLLIRSPLGNKILTAIEYVFITPRLHHTHHGWGKDGKSHRNFAVVLSVFDRFFQTLHIPEGRPAHYGVPGADKHWTEEVFFPLVTKWRRNQDQPSRSQPTATTE